MACCLIIFLILILFLILPLIIMALEQSILLTFFKVNVIISQKIILDFDMRLQER